MLCHKTNRRPSSTTIMHAMAFLRSTWSSDIDNGLQGWGYALIGRFYISGAKVEQLYDKTTRLSGKGFHFSPNKSCCKLTIHDWVECYGIKNGLPFVIHHKVGECKR